MKIFFDRFQCGDWWSAFWCFERVEAPIGAMCTKCEEPILPEDIGLFMPNAFSKDGESWLAEKPWHRECFLHAIFNEPEDKRPTRRESARATEERVKNESARATEERVKKGRS